MEKRLPLALFLSFLVYLIWSLLQSPPPPPPEGATRVEQTTPQDDTGRSEGVTAASLPEQTVADTITRTTPMREFGRAGEAGHYLASFTNVGGALHTLKLGGFYTRVGLTDAERRDPANWLPLVESVDSRDGRTGSLVLRTRSSSQAIAPRGLDDVLWEMTELENGAEFRYGPGTGVVFTKRITFEPGTWRIHVELVLENQGLEREGGEASFRILPAAAVPREVKDSFYEEPRAIAVPADGEDAVYVAATKVDPGETDGIKGAGGDIACGGVVNKYFAFLLRDGPRADGSGRARTLAGASYSSIDLEDPADERDLVACELDLKLNVPPVGERRSWSYTVFAGPKEPDVFVADFEPHQLVLDSDLGPGFCGVRFTSIGHALLVILRAIHDVVPNWGWAIILLTLGVRLVLFPLNRRSQTAMARYQTKMKRVQPRLEEIKKKYENDAQKLREAQARIMQEEGAFPPLGGCLPMFLQLPIFFGLFSMLRTSFDLRQQPFAFWITDLSRPDRLLEIDLALPLIGTVQYFNLLPILMVVMWILQQKGMPQPTDEQAARMQKMMMFMPIVFGFLLYNYAAGLSLYMLTTSTLGIFEQKVIKKVWPIDDAEVVKKKSGCGPFAGFMEQLAEKQKEQMKRLEGVQAQQRRQAAKKRKRRS